MTENKMMTIALAGNPNAGKTTLFVAMTGGRQHVGNDPGVTAEKKEGIQWALFQLGGLTLLAYVLTLIVYQVGSWF